MQSAKMDRRISIEYKSIEQDSTYGTELITWVLLETAWAEIQDALPSRSESVTQGLQVARNQTRIRMRWRDDITSDMRVIIHGDTDKIMQIVGGPADYGERKRMIEIVCEKYSS